MRFFIISDIHGNSKTLKHAIQPVMDDPDSWLICPGDILSPGPRNPITEGYNPSEVVEMLTAVKSRITAVRGNCDGDVDQMLLPFPVLADYADLFVWQRRIVVTHGHLFDGLTKLPFEHPSILISGHTHIPQCRESERRYHINPGSITIPKGGEYPASYGMLEEQKFTLFDLDHQILNSWDLNR